MPRWRLPRTPPRFWEAQTVLYRILAALLGTSHAEEPNTLRFPSETQGREEDRFVRRVDALLHAGYRSRITRAELAEKMGVSVSCLQHRYRVLTGKTIGRRLCELRIGYAKLLIAEGVPLEEAARLSGSCSAFYLSKVFHEISGMTPSGYRMSIRRA